MIVCLLDKIVRIVYKENNICKVLNNKYLITTVTIKKGTYKNNTRFI